MNIDFSNMETTFNSLTNLTEQHTAGIMEIIRMHSYYCYIINRVRSIRCTCVAHETKQADVNCPLCLGTGNKIKIYKIFCAAQDTKLPTTFRSDDFIVARDYYVPKKYRVNDEDIIIDSQGSIRYGFLKLNYAKMLQEWVKDIPQVSVNNTQIRVKNEYLQDIRLNSQEIELELY